MTDVTSNRMTNHFDTTSDIKTTLPGGGFVFRSKLSLEITANDSIEKLRVEEVGGIYEVKHPKKNKGVEVINFNNGKGDQTPHHFPVIIVWEAEEFQGSEDILILPGEVTIGGGRKILFLVAKTKETNREEVMETLCQRGITRWLEVCDMVLVNEKMNFTRKLFRDLSKAAEGMVTLVTGPSVKDINNEPSMLVLAKTISDQFNIMSYNMCSNLFMLHKYDDMKILTMIDQDCCLVITVLTMCSYKWSMFPNVEWKLLGNCSNFQVFWPVLACQNL